MMTPLKTTWSPEVDGLKLPLQRKEPRLVTVSGDLFDGSRDFASVAQVYAVMQLAQHHRFLVLTSHPEKALAFYEWLGTEDGQRSWLRAVVGAPRGGQESWSTQWPFKTVWLGVLVEDQASADQRIPTLLKCPAAVRWVLAELVGPVDFTDLACGENAFSTLEVVGGVDVNDPDGGIFPVEREHPSRIAWVVVAGQIGPEARPLHQDWVRSVQDQCAEAKVAFTFERWGEWCPRSSGYEVRDDVPRVRLTICGCNGQSDLPVGSVPGGETRHDCDGRYDLWVNRVGAELAGRRLGGKIYDEYPEAFHASEER